MDQKRTFATGLQAMLRYVEGKYTMLTSLAPDPFPFKMSEHRMAPQEDRMIFRTAPAGDVEPDQGGPQMATPYDSCCGDLPVQSRGTVQKVGNSHVTWPLSKCGTS
jgi:hypothetical protein